MMIASAIIKSKEFCNAFDILFVVFGLMFVVHVYGALKRIQPITETLEIGLWMILLVLNTLFYPARAINL
jgi:hypothetical protein